MFRHRAELQPFDCLGARVIGTVVCLNTSQVIWLRVGKRETREREHYIRFDMS